MDSNNKGYAVGSLFAGIGGICLGFKQAGFEIAWANDFDKNACITYRANFEHSLIEGDIHKINPDKLQKVDVITSGFPCQAFSIAGYRKGFHDKRGDLFFQTMRFIDEIKPKAFLLENVKNLTTHDKGNTFKVIKDYILNNGYSFIPKVLNSKEYGDVPQNRERIYIVGFKGEKDYWGEIDKKNICSNAFKFPESIPLTKKCHGLLEEEIETEDYSYEKYRESNKKMYNMLNNFMVNEESVYQYRRVYVRENKSNVCPTLTANMGTGGHNVPLIRDGGEIRKFSPRECARLQGFPDEFKFPENVSRGQLYKQIGNSVTVSVIERIAENIKIALDAKYTPAYSVQKELSRA
jgi:DNA (cytosine-5)-methyltransferase 1